MSASNRSLRYCAYLLRLWEVRPSEPDLQPTWRCRLEDPHTGQRHSFADLQSLITFLSDELASSNDVEPTLKSLDQTSQG